MLNFYVFEFQELDSLLWKINPSDLVFEFDRESKVKQSAEMDQYHEQGDFF